MPVCLSVRPSICRSIYPSCLSVCLSLFPKLLCRNSPNLVVMITTWQEGARAISFGPTCWGEAKRSSTVPKKCNYWHILMFLIFNETVDGIIIRRRIKSVTIIFGFHFWFLPQGLGTSGHRGPNKILFYFIVNSKFLIGSFLVELLPSFNLGVKHRGLRWFTIDFTFVIVVIVFL